MLETIRMPLGAFKLSACRYDGRCSGLQQRQLRACCAIKLDLYDARLPSLALRRQVNPYAGLGFQNFKTSMAQQLDDEFVQTAGTEGFERRYFWPYESRLIIPEMGWAVAVSFFLTLAEIVQLVLTAGQLKTRRAR